MVCRRRAAALFFLAVSSGCAAGPRPDEVPPEDTAPPSWADALDAAVFAGGQEQGDPAGTRKNRPRGGGDERER